MDVAIAIDAEAVPVTFRDRMAVAYDSRGRAIPVAPADTSGMAAIQPVSGHVLRDLPEGLRTDVSHVGWTRYAVAPGLEIIYGALTYRVVHIWPRPGDGFTKFAAMEKKG